MNISIGSTKTDINPGLLHPMNVWIDPSGKVYPVGFEGHDDFAYYYFKDNEIKNTRIWPEDGLVSLGWIKIGTGGTFSVHVVFDRDRRIPKVQQREITKLYTDNGVELPDEFMCHIYGEQP